MAPKNTKSKSSVKGVLVREFGRYAAELLCDGGHVRDGRHRCHLPARKTVLVGGSGFCAWSSTFRISEDLLGEARGAAKHPGERREAMERFAWENPPYVQYE